MTTSRAALLLIASLAGLCSACAAKPPNPADAIQAADTAIGRAEDARVADYAGAELRTAREKLAAARDAADKAGQDQTGKVVWQAQWLAEEARVDAEYADAKAQAERNAGVARQMQRDIDALQQEIQRGGGG